MPTQIDPDLAGVTLKWNVGQTRNSRVKPHMSVAPRFRLGTHDTAILAEMREPGAQALLALLVSAGLPAHERGGCCRRATRAAAAPIPRRHAPTVPHRSLPVFCSRARVGVCRGGCRAADHSRCRRGYQRERRPGKERCCRIVTVVGPSWSQTWLGSAVAVAGTCGGGQDGATQYT